MPQPAARVTLVGSNRSATRFGPKGCSLWHGRTAQPGHAPVVAHAHACVHACVHARGHANGNEKLHRVVGWGCVGGDCAGHVARAAREWVLQRELLMG